MSAIRAIVAEDSAVTREFLVALLSAAEGFEVVAAVQDGVEAVAEIERLRPDIVLMDIHMPRMDGLEATRRIMAIAPTPIVLVTASFSRDEGSPSFEAIRAGALTVVGKPAGPGHPDHARSVQELVQTVRLMSEVKVVGRRPPRGHQETALPPRARRVRVVALGASTGGPAVLAEILGGLDDETRAPILIVQHIAPGFTSGLVRWLAGETRLPVSLAEEGQPVRPASVYVAPDGLQMGMSADGRLRLEPGGSADPFCPSASHLFDSVAEACGASAMGVLLTGMGRDGAAGLGRLRTAGAITVAQDEGSSVVFGMPAEAVRLGAAEHVLPPREIVRLIRSHTGEAG
jgi:two-component system, chemotaxis family, protein-glutamate methylesterase/glutaminase